jgi:hypothetical protein
MLYPRTSRVPGRSRPGQGSRILKRSEIGYCKRTNISRTKTVRRDGTASASNPYGLSRNLKTSYLENYKDFMDDLDEVDLIDLFEEKLDSRDKAFLKNYYNNNRYVEIELYIVGTALFL